MLQQIVGTTHFINKLTGGKLTEKQLNRAAAYLKKEGICFYDTFSREHCSILDTLACSKTTVINALRETLKK